MTMKNANELKRVPGPKGTLIGGNLRSIKDDHLNFFYDSYKKYGDVVRFRFGPVFSYLISKPEYVEQVLKNNRENYIRKSRAYSIVGPLLKNSIGFSEGELWKKQRKLSNQFFNREDTIKKFPRVVETARDFEQRLEEIYQNKESFDLYHEMDKTMINSFDKLFLQLDMAEYMSSLIDDKNFIMSYCYEKISRVFTVPKFIPTKKTLRFKKSMKNVRDMLDEMIMRNENRTSKEKNIFSALSVSADDLNKTKFRKQVHAELLGYFFMSHGTSALSLTWTLYLLAKHPEIEKRLLEEINTKLAGRTPVFEDLDKLEYMDCVLKESMRLYPPAWLLSRRSVKKDSMGEYRISARSSINISPYIIHRNKDCWENPEEFDPDRFSIKNRDKIKLCSYIPFGFGPNTCVGGNVYFMEAKPILAIILRKFRFHLLSDEKIVPKPAYVLFPNKPILMNVELRK